MGRKQRAEEAEVSSHPMNTYLAIVALLLFGAVAFIANANGSRSVHMQGAKMSAQNMRRPNGQRAKWEADSAQGEGTSGEFTWVMPNKRRKGPRTVSRWVDEDRPGTTASTTSAKLSECTQAPKISEQTRALLQKRDFASALELAKGETDGFMREFIHARPFFHTELFDWVIKSGNLVQGKQKSDARRILTDASWKSMALIVKLLDKLKDPSFKRAIVFAQTDEHNSGWAVPPDQNWSKMCCKKPKIPQYKDWWCFCQKKIGDIPEQIKILQDSGKFSSIAWEAMDVPQAGLRPHPIPFTTGYSKMAGGAAGKNVMSHAKSIDMEAKTGIIAAWGTSWPKLDHMVLSRINGIEWLKDNPLVQRTSVPPDKYHGVLAGHRFAMCPTGGGVQSPKVFEALLLKTIPIVQREGAAAYVGLAELGYPIVVVDKWEEITESNMDKWWDKFSPMLDRARWMLLTDVWYAFATFPCPIDDIGEFLDYLSKEEA